MSDVEAIADRMAIADVITRYSRGIDRLDRALLESVYWPDARDDHVNYVGDAAGFIDWAFQLLRPMRTSHFIGNMLIELTGPAEARGETYVNAYHLMPGASGPEELVVGARYVDRFQKRADEWRILERRLCIDWSQHRPPSESPRYRSITRRGERFPDDVSYQLFNRQ